ncbi:MAG: Uma2 family endonuclease [Sarcina sp.]
MALIKRDNKEIYETLCKTTDDKVEMINNEIYCSSFTSKNHNIITGRLFAKLDDFLYGKPCKVFSEQIEVILSEDSKVKPDIFVVCPNETGEFEELGQSYITVPILIFEVVSESNAKLDTIEKMNLYSTYGIKEYCLVYQDGRIEQYILHNDYYRVANVYSSKDIYKSIVFENLEIDLNRIFSDIIE